MTIERMLCRLIFVVIGSPVKQGIKWEREAYCVKVAMTEQLSLLKSMMLVMNSRALTF